MLCERCKIREANIQYTEVINGVRTEHHFCTQCAKEMDFGQYSAIFDGEFPLGKLLSGLLGIGEPVQKEEKIQQIVCPTCGTTYEEFVDNSRFGCADCYSVFDLLISDKMKQLQGSEQHTGKTPIYQNAAMESTSKGGEGKAYRTREEEVRALEIRLREAIRKEEYEVAAECRDKIKELKEENA
ncbi:MAG: UvrB/UvrC motif-containing protein [Lachnospiraceae bacterium]|nr:UvrB/UvrC motif-containing protein [Lachnospiraceae bacterium]